MKRFILLIIVLLIPINAWAIQTSASTAILMDMDSGRILYEKNKDEQRLVASITKIMTAVLAIENASLEEEVTVGEEILSMYGSNIYIEVGEKIKLRDLLYGLLLRSSNDAAIVIANYIGKNEENFVKMMNDKAKELNLVSTHFVNSTGLDEKGHFSSAYDLSIIAIELMKHPDVFKYTTIYEDYLRKNTNNNFWLVNTNKLLKSYKGVDGLKTGMTDNAGYCMAVTAKREGMRILAMVLGEKEGKVRNRETAELRD